MKPEREQRLLDKSSYPWAPGHKVEPFTKETTPKSILSPFNPQSISISGPTANMILEGKPLTIAQPGTRLTDIDLIAEIDMTRFKTSRSVGGKKTNIN